MTRSIEDAQASAELIRTMHDQVRGELTRVDSKPSTLLALNNIEPAVGLG